MGGLGILQALNLEKRVRELEELDYGINLLSKEIVYGQTRLPAALAICGQQVEGEVGSVFTQAAELLKGKDLKPRKAIEIAVSRCQLASAEAKRILFRLSDQLGMSGVMEQERFLALALEEVRLCREKAEKQASSQGKVYRWGGFLLGGMLALMLI